ncbi:MAG: M12 family metallopeptidase, partial [Bryobacteraceae bacterium]
MKRTYKFDLPSRRHLLGAAMLLTTMSAFSQTVQLSQPAETGFAGPSGEYFAVPELPRPEWQEEMGVPVARLRLAAPNAAAWSVAFESLGLGNDAQMFLYGINAGVVISAVHGPYEKDGPLNVPGFQTQIIEGAELMIEVRGGRKFPAWPFTFESVERIDAAQLAALKEKGMQLEAVYRPQKRQHQASEVRYAWFDEQLVPYRVIDGKAIVGGDIVLGPVAEVGSGNAGKSKGRRESHEDTRSFVRWPNGVIPYTIEYTPALWPGHTMETRILNAIAHMNEKLPGILVKRTTQADYMTFRLDSKSGACFSEYGRIGGQQFITLNMGCTTGSIIHEIGHAVGMWHEHQRPDRDWWLTIHWQNIDPDFKYAFEIPSSGTRMLGAYDLGSIMHYGKRTASVDPWTKDTFSLKVLPPEGVVVGQRKG